MADNITDAIAEWRKHGTPGPWEMTRVNHLDGTAEMMFSNRARDKIGKEWLSEAWFDFARTWIRQRGSSEDYPTGKANARIIAAVPEMAARIEAMEAGDYHEGIQEGWNAGAAQERRIWRMAIEQYFDGTAVEDVEKYVEEIRKGVEGEL